VCPGTSSWNSLAGRTTNAVQNISRAAVAGAAAGATGLLLTDWGDNGHMQPLPVSYPGFALGAAAAWSLTSARELEDLDLPGAVDAHLLEGKVPGAGAALCELGDSYLQTGCLIPNGTILFRLLLQHGALSERQRQDLSAGGLERALDHIDRAVARVRVAPSGFRNGARVWEEIAWVADALRLGGRIGLARLTAGLDQPLGAVDPALRAPLAAQLSDLIPRYRRRWLARNRRGGLDDSAGQLLRLLSVLERQVGLTSGT
jgi:hypothetical protein